MEETLMTLTALAEACEGRLQLGFNGIDCITTDDDLNFLVHMQDSRQLEPWQLDKAVLEDAVFQWRQQHPAFFQRIIGSMM